VVDFVGAGESFRTTGQLATGGLVEVAWDDEVALNPYRFQIKRRPTT